MLDFDVALKQVPPSPPRNPCWLRKLRDADPENYAKVVGALQDKSVPTPTIQRALALIDVKVSLEVVRRHRVAECASCNA